MARYWRPEGLEEALRILAEARPTIMAGGTRLVREGSAGTADLLDITGIPALRGVAQQGDTWRIGAATTWAELKATKLPPLFDGLRGAAETVGSPQVQNQGTIGGNLLARFLTADGVPALLCLDASLEIVSIHGVRCLPVASFLSGETLRPDEVLAAILVPCPTGEVRCGFAKHGSRQAVNVAEVTAAVRLDVGEGRVTDARIALGACVAVPRRLPVLEAALRNQPLGAALAGLVGPQALEGTTMVDDFRAPAAHRSAVAQVLLRRLLAAAGAAA